MSQQPPPPPSTFTAEANRHLSTLSAQHAIHLQTGDDLQVLGTTQAAATIRRATIVYVAAMDILPAVMARESPKLAREARYLNGLVSRLWQALLNRDVQAMSTLADAAQAVLDGFQGGEEGLFERMQVVPFAVDGNPVGLGVGRREEVVGDGAGERGGSVQTAEIFEEEGAAAVEEGRKVRRGLSRVGSGEGEKRRWCGLSCVDLSGKDKMVLWLYLCMCLLAVVAIAAVTVNFAQQQINPGSFIRSEVTETLVAPVVTVCLSQPGVPFSRLQLFNFTSADGVVFQGALPNGSQEETQSDEFAEVVDRFWDNPDGEDCKAVVGDFYPFPINSLNDLAQGRKGTKCRQCYRVGRKKEAKVTSTDFRNSSVLNFYTDNYFLQCLKTTKGLDEDSLEFMHEQVKTNKDEMKELGVLEFPDGLSDDQFEELEPEQICNLMYFAYFPKKLEKEDENVDIRYVYENGKWEERGGPFFRLPKRVDQLPEESLQLFVGTKESTQVDKIGNNRDMILIGPNTQTFATFRPVVVYGSDRYDISSSTSNLMQGAITPLFGYWLVYRIYYNYNRFVTDEWYRESTYPASQWIVDLTGYASLFTGASLFSLLLLPLLRAARRREKHRLIKQQPEVYLWSQHKQRYPEAVGALNTGPEASNGDGNLMRGTSVMLPGYNV